MPERELDGHGIYLIVRLQLPSDIRFNNPTSFESWLAHLLSLPTGTIESTLPIHYASGGLSIKLGVSELSSQDKKELEDARFEPGVRNLFRSVLAELPPTVLYCGETYCFRKRIYQHLDGSLAWARLVEAGYTPRELEFWLLPVPEVPDPQDKWITDLRRLVERIVAQLTLAAFTERPG